MAKSLARKLKETPFALRLLSVCESIPALEFSEYNPEGDFGYVKASQVYEAFRSKLFAQKILLLSNETDILRELLVSPDGYTYREIAIRVQFVVIDCLSAERMTFEQYGTGVSSLSTGYALYIAKTMAKKYFLRDLGMIPWAEGDQELQSRDLPAEKPAKKHMTRAEKEQDSKIRAWHSGLLTGCKTEEQSLFYLVQEHSCKSFRDFFVNWPTRKADCDRAIAWAIHDMPTEDDVRILQESKGKVTTMQPKGAQPAVVAGEAEREDEISGD